MTFTLLDTLALPSLMPVIGDYLVWLVDKVGNIGLAIVLFTATLRVLMLPLDYWSRAGMKKNSLKMEQMKPQLDKLQKQYAHDKALLNQKMQALYKKEGYSMMGSCLPMLVTMALFIIVFRAFNTYLQYNLIDSYNKMSEAFLAVGEDPEAWAAIASEYTDTFQPSFLWIKNIWLSDVFWKQSVMDASTFETLTGVTVDAVMSYNPMIAPLLENSTINGYFILPIICVLTAWLSQKIMTSTQKTQTEMAGQEQTQKMMAIMLPAMMGFFAISSHTAFALYLVTSQLLSIFTTILINKIVSIRFRKMIAEEEARKEQARINR
ncbi:MAG: YidC/Oxa1 family membrane protein insertase [Bacillota bacterium]